MALIFMFTLFSYALCHDRCPTVTGSGAQIVLPNCYWSSANSLSRVN